MEVKDKNQYVLRFIFIETHIYIIYLRKHEQAFQSFVFGFMIRHTSFGTLPHKNTFLNVYAFVFLCVCVGMRF